MTWSVIPVIGSYTELGEHMEAATKWMKNESYHEHIIHGNVIVFY